MKYFVYVHREYSSNSLTEFATKEQALQYVSTRGDEDGWFQIICGEELRFQIKHVAYEVIE